MKAIEEAKRVLKIEAESILGLIERLDSDFEKAVDLIVACRGKVIVTGMGKSGQIGRKISSTLSSTGTPSVFLHPAESSHGDLGVISPGDIVIGISYGGESQELDNLLKFVARKDIPLISMTSKAQSSLAKAGTVFLDISVQTEACPLGLAPTSSSTATLALGDALAMAALQQRGFQEKEFAEFHPGGKLGRKLLLRVRDLMHSGDSLPLVGPKTGLKDILALMTQAEVRGVAGVIDEKSHLIGIITDGGIRHCLQSIGDLSALTASDIMSKNPKTIDHDELAERALFIMDQFNIDRLFVMDKNSNQLKKPIGLIHIQDLLNASIR